MKAIKIILIGLAALFLATPLISRATELEFNIDPAYDFSGRSKVSAFLYQIGANVYFYVEDDFYNGLDIDKKKEFSEAVKNLSLEFDANIYPKLREAFGSEPNPGIDQDSKIFILLIQMKGEAGGYFNSGDGYSKLQSPESNEKEIIYLNASLATSHLAKSFLAHEFTHLITFNQKDKLQKIADDVWLNEARAEYAPSLLGYDGDYPSSNLKKRVKAFLEKPNDSLTEWRNEAADYGVINLFSQYLVERYGLKIFSDSLKSSKVGIDSINEALKNNGFSEDFSRIFSDWTVVLVVNDCALGQKYCYSNPNLKSLRISPQLNFLPSIGESSLTVTNFAKNWQGNWFKFVGGQGTLKLEFIGDSKVSFKVPYLLETSLGKYSLDYLNLNNLSRGTNYFSDFGKKGISLTIIPSAQSKTSGFTSAENYYKFFWTVSTVNSPEAGISEQEKLINDLLFQIALLKEQIAKLQAQNSPNCAKLESSLYFGLRNNSQVRCLQEFLKGQGQDIYPGGLVTGNFGALTKAAVIRFQKKSGLPGTGFVGPLTLSKINRLLGK